MILVSLTTSPTRIHTLKPILKRLMEQTVQPDKIVLNVPYVFKRTGETYTIPEYLYQPWLHINRCEDIGPATKIIPTRELVKDPETIIISVDDDILYKKDMIETFLKYSHLPYVLSGGGPVGNYKKIKIGDEIINVSQMIEGYGGVCYRKKHLDKIKISNTIHDCFTSDDFIISNQLGKHQIVILKLPNTISKILKIGLKKDALHKISDNNEKYQACATHLKKKNQLFIEHFT